MNLLTSPFIVPVLLTIRCRPSPGLRSIRLLAEFDAKSTYGKLERRWSKRVRRSSTSPNDFTAVKRDHGK